jgi:hypothetical protein
MEVSGEAIVRGLPATTLSVTAAAPHEDCVRSFLDSDGWYAGATAFVSGSDSDPSCPAAGDRVSIVVEGDTDDPVTVTFAPGGVEGRDLVAHGDSMRVHDIDITGATIGGVECAVIMDPPPGAFVAPGAVTAFVLSDEVRAGCGAPGRTVTFFRVGRPLTPTLPWVPGRVDSFVEFTFADVPVAEPTPQPARNVVTLPNTGSGAANADGSAGLTGIAVMLAAGVAVVIAGAAARRRSEMTLDRQLAVADAGAVEDGVRDGGGDRDDARFAGAR